jgi:2,3-bisphosphoglycerate-dependent phosphoglycerate mutase
MSTLVLLRHGQSEWNRANRFTGWWDVDLSPDGVHEAQRAAELLAAAGVEPDVAFSSLLTRAVRTLTIVLESLGRPWLPTARHWRLNERHYGALTGLDKAETEARHGTEQYLAWRRSYATPPPPIEPGSAYDVSADPRYRDLTPGVMPATECLADVVGRLLPYWQDAIAPELLAGRCVLVAAHGNSLRALVKYLERISDEDITGLEVPTGTPIVYRLGADLELLDKSVLEP